jgi:hypothetical protein
MDRAQADPISFQRNVILGLLLALSAAAWAALRQRVLGDVL